MFTTGTATDCNDLAERLHTFLSAKGSAFGLTYSGVGDGRLTSYCGGASSVAETFTITATSPTSFDVVGAVTGSIGPATVGTAFVHATLEFVITAGAIPFTPGDQFTLSTAPKWTSLRRSRGCRLVATQVNEGMYAVQNLVDGKLDIWPFNTGGLANRSWNIYSTVTLPQEVEITFFEPVTIAAYELTLFETTGQAPDDWQMQYWDGATWVTLDTRVGINFFDGIPQTFTIASPVSATRYRWHITGLRYSQCHMGTLRMFRQADGVDACFHEYAWMAPGNDGTSEIFVAVHGFERQDADYHDWEIAGMDGWVPGARLYQQPGLQGNLYLPLWNAAIPYWFIADGRRAVVIAKISNQYEIAAFGLLDPYYSPNQWPYPLFLGGSMSHGEFSAWNDTDYRWSLADNRHRIPTHADTGNAPVGSGERDPWDTQLRVRNLDGGWKALEGSYLDSITSTPTTIQHLIWPTRCGLSLLDPGPGATYDLWPVMLMLGDVGGGTNTPGQLPGIALVTGQGLTAETLIRQGAVDWIVIPNVFRNDRDDFCAVRLD
jgi:hypothetical protein